MSHKSQEPCHKQHPSPFEDNLGDYPNESALQFGSPFKKMQKQNIY